MQSNNSSSVNPDQPLITRRHILIAICIFLLIAALLFTLFGRKKPAGSYGEYYDPASKETISNPKGKTPENNGNSQLDKQPIYLGFGKLLEFGVSEEQLRVTKEALSRYSPQAKEISVYIDSVNTVQVERGERPTISFDLLIDRTTKAEAKLEYFDSTSIRLKVSDRTRTQPFDSGDLDASKIPNPATQTTPDPDQEVDVDQGDGGPPSP